MTGPSTGAPRGGEGPAAGRPGPAPRPAPTMADVAERAGVSTMTVSRALKGGGTVSEATRLRIVEAVDELGYVLDQTAGTLSSRRSGFVAVLIPSLNNSNFSDTVGGLARRLEASGLQMLLGATGYDRQREEELVATLLRRRPEGIVVTGGSHTERARRVLASAGIPVVEMWDLPRQPIGHVVGFSNAAAAAAMVHHLHGRGYRAIGYIGGSTDRDTRGLDRRRGYEQAVRDLGLPQGLTVACGDPPISMEQGGEAVVRLLGRHPEVDAVVCVSDLSAFGALAECQRRGWPVPGRLAIAGFGDFEVSRCCHPRLTTISVDAPGIGEAAGGLLLRAITAGRGGAAMFPETLRLPFAILERETT